MKYLLLTFDLEEFVPAAEFNEALPEKEAFEFGRQGFENILQVLEEKQIKATLFATAEFAKYSEKLIRRAVRAGHELASHGYSHKHNYKKMLPADALRHLKSAKASLEENFGKKVLGFRAPQMFHPDRAILKKIGFEYDSSFHPTYVPGRYNNFFGKRKIFAEKGITVVPVSVSPILRLPFSWVWFRLLPLSYSKFCTMLALADQEYVNIYFHPWEFTDVDSCGFKKIQKSRTKNTGEHLLKKLSCYLDWCNGLKLKSVTISNYLHSYESKRLL